MVNKKNLKKKKNISANPSKDLWDADGDDSPVDFKRP